MWIGLALLQSLNVVLNDSLKATESTPNNI